MESENKKVILVATDFTKIGGYAVDNAANMASLINGKLIVLHVINQATKEKLQKENKDQEVVGNMLQEICTELREKRGIDANYLAPIGSIFSVIAETAKSVGANYLFMGTHGKKGIQFLLGSFALKVITSSPIPIIIVKKPAVAMDYKNLVFALDLRLGSKQKVKYALDLHRMFGTVFHLFVHCPEDSDLKRKANSNVLQVSNILTKNKIPFTIEYHKKLKGYETRLMEYAKEKNASAIMLSTDPDKVPWNPFGSVEERIIYNQEAIPVICINAKDLNLIPGIY
ncbi:MAG TPA: universal stress protein [Bacteroidales bacterium]|nr:universal stress protein [Bacteroidales bacterium]